MNRVLPHTCSSPTDVPSAGSGVPSSAANRVRTPGRAVPTWPGRRSPSARALTVIKVSVMPYRSTGRSPVSACSVSNTGTGRGALPETSSRAEASARAESGSWHTRPHTVGTPEVQGAACGGAGPPGVDQPRPGAQGTEDAEDEPVHVVERQPVDESVVGGPRPRVGQRVQVGRDGVPADHHTLRRAGGAAGVKHERRIPAGRLAELSGRRSLREADGHGWHGQRRLRIACSEVAWHEHQGRAGVGEEMLALHRPVSSGPGRCTITPASSARCLRRQARIRGRYHRRSTGHGRAVSRAGARVAA